MNSARALRLAALAALAIATTAALHWRSEKLRLLQPTTEILTPSHSVQRVSGAKPTHLPPPPGGSAGKGQATAEAATNAATTHLPPPAGGRVGEGGATPEKRKAPEETATPPSNPSHSPPGGRPGRGEQPLRSPAPSLEGRPLLLFGDSRIAHWRPLPPRPYPIARQGHPGESAIRLVPTFAAALETHRPALVVLQLGMNDATAAALALPAERERAFHATTAAFVRMAATARAQGVPLVILEPIPPIRPSLARRLLLGGRDIAYARRLTAALPAIAAAHGATVVNALPLLGPAPDAVPERYRRDSVHLTPQAYARLDILLPASLSAEARPPAG